MPTRIDPSLLVGSSAPSSNDARYRASLEKAAQNRQAFQNQDWDPVIRPIEHIFNALTAAGSGVKNSIDKGIKGGIEAGPLGVVGGVAGGFVNGFFASWNNDPQSENYMPGDKFVESVTDRIGNAYNPSYVDREDNVEPGLKFGLGLAADIFLDPITYVPGGIIASGVRGAKYGARAGAAAAKAGEAVAGVPRGRISGALQGVFKGAPDAYKVGRITKAPKAIGIDQWKQVRNYDKINKLQRKHGLTEEMMFAITSGAHGIKALTEEILPGLRKTAGEEYKANLTPELVQEIADKARKYIDDYTAIASGAEGARAVRAGMAAPEGVAAYKYADPVTGKVKPGAFSRPSALARREAVATRLGKEEKLSDLEIQRYDVQAALEPQIAKRAELMAQRTKLAKSIKTADARAPKASAAAQRAAMNADVEAQIKSIDDELITLDASNSELIRKLSGLQKDSAELAAALGKAPEQAKAINEVITQMAQRGILYSPIMDLDTSSVRFTDLLDIDVERELTEGATAMMLQSLSIALKNGQIDDMAIGKIAEADVALSDVIDLLYTPGGNEALAKIKGLTPEAVAFYTDVVHQVLYKMWDITGAALRVAANGQTMGSFGRAANGLDLFQWAVTDAAKQSAIVARETMTEVKAKLDDFTPEMQDQRPEEYYALVEEMSKAEQALRFIEEANDPAINAMAPYMFIGGVESAVEASKTISAKMRKTPGWQQTVLENINAVREANKKIANAKNDFGTPAALQTKNDALIAGMSALIRAHSDSDEILQAVKALIGENDDPVRGLLDLAFGTFKPLKAAEMDPTLYGKLIIQLAKLPFEIPGISNTARLRARAFAKDASLGVYGLEETIDEAALARYGREMLNNFQITGGYVSPERAKMGIEATPEQVLDDMSDLVNRQAKAMDEANVELAGDQAGLGFAMGENIAGLEDTGRYGALNIFGEVVARGETREELARNLELYRGFVAGEASIAVANALESSITGRALEFRGETVKSFNEFWEAERAGFLSPNRTANFFEQSAGTIIRGREATGYKRILDNDDAELDSYGTRLSPELQLIPEKGPASPLSFTHVGAFTLEGVVFQTGAHALYGMMASKGARRKIAEAETVAEAKRIFDGLNAKDINPTYLSKNNIIRGNYIDAVADQVFAARINVPGVRESMEGTRGFNVVDGFDTLIGGVAKKRIEKKGKKQTQDPEYKFSFAPLIRVRGSNVAGRAIMRSRDKALGVEVKNISFGTSENRLPVGQKSGVAVIDTEFAKLFPGRETGIKVSDHILGYAREPLLLDEWVALIHVAAFASKQAGAASKRSGAFSGRYVAVAKSLGIPIDEKAALGAALESIAVKAAYARYRAEFDRVLRPEIEAGRNIRVSEALQGRGDDPMFDKGQFEDLRSLSETEYGVDPLGRSVRAQEEFRAGGKESGDPTLFSKLSSVLTENDVKTIFNVLNKSKTEEEVIKQLNQFIGEHFQTAVMPLIRDYWGSTRQFGYTAESSGTIANIRSAIAGSPVGVQVILEDLLPDLRLTRETQDEFIKMLQRAEQVVTEERVTLVRGEIDIVLNGPAAAALADPTGEIAQILLNFELKGKGVARKLAPLSDEVITSSEKEVRDWATGGVKIERGDSDQFTGPDYIQYDSFSDIAVQDLIRELVPGVGQSKDLMIKIKKAFTAIARKAQELHEIGPDGNYRIKGSPEEYTAAMNAEIAKSLNGAKTQLYTFNVPLSALPDAKTLLYTSPFRGTLEEFLRTAGHSHDADIMKNLDKMDRRIPALPIPTWRKFVQKIDSLLGREIKGSGGQTERIVGTSAARVQELLQIDDAGHSRLISAVVNMKNVDEYFTNAQRDIINRTNIVDSHGILGGEQIVEAAKTVDQAVHLAGIAEDITNVLAALSKTPELKILGQGVINKFRQRIADSITNTIKNFKSEKNYNTYGNDVDRAAMHDVLQEIDRGARIANASDDGIAYLKYLALKIADEELARMGVSRVTTLGTKLTPGRIKYSINGEVDWAYLGYSDMVTVLRETGNNALVKRLLTEIMPDTTKAIRGVETGLIFPPNVIAEMGVLTMKLRIGGVSENDAAAILYSTIIKRLEVTPGKLFKSIVDKVNLTLPQGPNAERIAEIALALSRADVQDAIITRHVTNGAVALQRAGDISRNITEDIVKQIMKTVTSPLSTLDDAVEQIIKTSGRLRAQIEKFGIEPDSLAGHLSRGTIQKLLSGVFSSTQINIARVTSRTLRVFDEIKNEKPSLARTVKWRRIQAEENTRLAAQRIKTTNRLSAENTAILIEDLINSGDPISMVAAYDVAISAVESSYQASLHIAQIHLGGGAYLEAVETQRSRARDIANGIAGTEAQIAVNTQRLNELAGQRANLEARKLKIIKQKIVGKNVSTTKAQEERKRQLAMVEEELNVLNTRIAELNLTDKFIDESFIPDDMDRITLQSMEDTGLGYKAAAAFSGSAAAGETAISIVARTENSIDNNINSLEKMLEKVANLVSKKMSSRSGETVTIKRLGDEDMTVDKAVLDWGGNILRQLWVNDVPIETLLKRITDPDMRALTIEVHRLSAELFGPESKIMVRSGMDANHINTFIKQSPFGLTKAAQFDNGRIGYELQQNIKDKLRELLDPDGKVTGEGGADWITAIKGYSWSLQRAAMIPTIAAEFSARFGHKAAGISIEEARKRGYQAITDQGTLGKWLDSNQLYPPEYLRQMANTQRFLNIDTRVKGDHPFAKFIRGTDKVTGALKSSITLWRPGHHVVNVMGEFLMNVLAGVINPVRYAQAWKTMRSVGEWSPDTTFGHNLDIPLNEFSAGYKNVAFTGKNGDEGIVMQLAGREVVISYPEFYRMLNEKGLLINNNTAEDIIVQGEQIVGSRNRYSGLLGGLQRANEGLGAFSARRDNIFRIAHAIDIASKKGHRSMGTMIDDISSEVMSYHPTMQLLSPFEKKYMRRAMYFYTWQRNAISVVFRSMLENPGYFTLAPKTIYEASAINGDPESIGHPMPNDMRLPGFMSANTLGPHWFDENGNIQGMTLNAPQLDIFNTVFGELYVDPTQNPIDNVTRNLATLYRENTIGQMSPLPKTMIESWMGSKYTTAGPQPINDAGDYLIDQTGLGYLSRIAGINLLNNQGFLGQRTDAKDEETRTRYGINALTGLRLQDMSQYADVAKRQQDERFKRAMEELLQRLNGTP